VPAATPTTAPEPLTVATFVFEEDHGVVVNGFVVALKLTFDPTQIEDDPVITGNGFTITVTFLIQPLVFVYVIILVPNDEVVTNPPALTAATLVVAETHGFVVAAVALPVSWLVLFKQIIVSPVMVGNGFTVNVTSFLQPFELV
jgi:hypothetical protein